MALFRRENIAVPDERKDQIVYKWPDLQIRRFTKAIVAPDEVAVFFYQGAVIGTLPPGRHQVDATELPFLGHVQGHADRRQRLPDRALLRLHPGHQGPLRRPRRRGAGSPTGMLVTLRVFGDYVLKVTDPTVLITKYSGTQNVPDNGKITDLCDDLLLRSLRQDLTKNIVRNGWPVLGLAAYTDEIEQTTVEGGNARLADYGLSLVGLTNFVVSLDDETEAELRRLAKDTAYSRLAGGFQQYAAGEMALGAGEGMAKGGGGVSGAFLGAGIGLGGVAAQPPPPGPPPPPAPGFAGGGGGYAGPAGGHGGLPLLPGGQHPGREVLRLLRHLARAADGQLRLLPGAEPAGLEVLRLLRHLARSPGDPLQQVRHRARRGRALLRLLRHPDRRPRPGTPRGGDVTAPLLAAAGLLARAGGGHSFGGGSGGSGGGSSFGGGGGSSFGGGGHGFFFLPFLLGGGGGLLVLILLVVVGFAIFRAMRGGMGGSGRQAFNSG